MIFASHHLRRFPRPRAATLMSGGALLGLVLVAACAASEGTGPSGEQGPVVIPESDAGTSNDGAVSDAADEAAVIPCAIGNLCKVTSPLTSGAIAAMSGRSKDDVWASGSGGVLMHWDGKQWTSVESQLGETFYGIFLSADEMWAVAGPLVLRRGLASDTVRTARTEELVEGVDNYRSIAGVSVLPNGETFVGFAPGYKSGAYYRAKYFAKLDFASAKVSYQPDALDPLGNQPQTDIGVRAQYLVPDKALWLVGDRASVVRYAVSPSGDAGTPALERGVVVPVVSQVNLRAAWGHDDELWAAGEHGAILHYDGSAWHFEDTGTTSVLHAIFGITPNDIWAGGEDGTVLHFDGTIWSPIATDHEGTFRAVWGSASDDVWIGGDGGLFHWGALP